MSDTRRTVKGVIWSGIERFSVQIIQFTISIILARILSPTDFGLLALILVIINILQTINEVGFGAALMQKLDRDELDFSTVFVFNIILGFILYGFVYFLSPAIANFFNNSQLTLLTRLLGLNLIISSFVIVQRTRLYINVDFKTQAKASLIAVVISGSIGVYFAFNGFGVMALIFQSLINSVINTIMIWFLVKWKLSLKFSYSRFSCLFKYAYKLILARLVNSVFNEMYSLVIGRFYTPSQLGLFNRAKSFTDLSSSNIASIVQRVSTPVLCEEQNDNKRMGELLLKFITKTAFIVYPILFGLFVLAEPIISVLLTDKWLPSAWILRILCPVGMMFVISTFNMNVFNATGKTGWALKSEIIKKSIFVAIIAISLLFGFKALVYSQIAIGFIDLLISTYYTRKQIGLRIKEQLFSLKSIFLVSLIMALIVYFNILIFENNIQKLIFGILIGAFVYISSCYIFNILNTKSAVKSILSKVFVK